MRAALWASRSDPFFRGLVLSAVLEWGGQKVRNSPWVDPRIIPVFWRMIPLMEARSDLHWV